MAIRRILSISVGRRIALLIIAEALMMGLLVGYLSRALWTLASDIEYTRRFVISPTEALADAMEHAAVLEAELDTRGARPQEPSLTRIHEGIKCFQALAERYRVEWQSADNPSEDARRFREELERAGRVGLLQDELRGVELIESAGKRLRDALTRPQTAENVAFEHDLVEDARQGIRMLLATNVRFVAVDNELHAERARAAGRQLVGLGIVVFCLTLGLGLHIRSAIGPRLAAMADKVRTFQETGEYTRTAHPGSDDIAVLSNALDAGFSAIRERDRERERFLAVAAHELKTPLISITGFAEAALASSDHAFRDRALDVVRRQTSRINRLVQDLLLAASARNGSLAFHPVPTEERALVAKVMGEVEDRRHRFVLADGPRVFLLGDVDLLGHALWQILSYASAIADKDSIITISIRRQLAHAIIDVFVPQTTVTADEIERAFLPFASVQYEGAGLRYAVGLYLSREIARIHGGALTSLRGKDGSTTLRLELPA